MSLLAGSPTPHRAGGPDPLSRIDLEPELVVAGASLGSAPSLTDSDR